MTFAVYSERGSIDLLAWNGASGTLLVVEVKTVLASIEETLRRHDVKARLAGRLAAERFGWRAADVSRLLVLPDTSTARRRVARHAPVFELAYPERGQSLRRWLAHPAGAIGGIAFVSQQRAIAAQNRKRVRRAGAPGEQRAGSVAGQPPSGRP